MHKFTEIKTKKNELGDSKRILDYNLKPLMDIYTHPLATKYKIALTTLIKYREERLRAKLDINKLAMIIDCINSSSSCEFGDPLYDSILKGVNTLKRINLLNDTGLEEMINDGVESIWKFKPRGVSFFDYFSLCLSLTGLAFAERLEEMLNSSNKDRWLKAGKKFYNILSELNYKKVAYVIGSLLVETEKEGKDIRQYIQQRRSELLDIENKVKEKLKSIENKGITIHIITGRVKSPYSTLKKFLKRRLNPYDDINKVVTDLLGIRVVFEGDMNKCVIETIKELSNDFQLFAIKDYFNSSKEGNEEAWLRRLQRNGLKIPRNGFIINKKKKSGYKAIHLIFKSKDIYFEVQLRTLEDHNNAEWGNAEHVRYKEGALLLKSAIERLKSAHLIDSKEVFIEVNGFGIPLTVWGGVDKRSITREVAKKTNGIIISNGDFVAKQINKIISDERTNRKHIKITLYGNPIRESGGKTIFEVHKVSVGFKKI